MRRVAYVMAKAPRPGESKTRLCPPLLPRDAADLAAAFLLDAIATVHAAGIEARVQCRDSADAAALCPLIAGRAEAFVQEGAGLGDGLASAFLQGFSDGYDAVGVFGADSPTLPASAISLAFKALRAGADVGFGPSDDGGYYLLTAQRAYPELFRDIAWSTSTVAAETLTRCRSLGLRVHSVATWYDVDDADSLERLRTDLAGLPSSIARHTRATLRCFDLPACSVPLTRQSSRAGGIA